MLMLMRVARIPLVYAISTSKEKTPIAALRAVKKECEASANRLFQPEFTGIEARGGGNKELQIQIPTAVRWITSDRPRRYRVPGPCLMSICSLQAPQRFPRGQPICARRRRPQARNRLDAR